MGKKYKVNYHSSDGVIEIILRDSTGKKESKFTCNQNDKRGLVHIGDILSEKYGIYFEKKDFFSYT